MPRKPKTKSRQKLVEEARDAERSAFFQVPLGKLKRVRLKPKPKDAIKEACKRILEAHAKAKGRAV
jgi:hypothetical protein